MEFSSRAIFRRKHANGFSYQGFMQGITNQLGITETMPSDLSLPSLLADLHAHAARSGDAALQERLQHWEAELTRAAGGAITVGNINGSTAVAVGNNIYQFVQQFQFQLPPDFVAQLNALRDALEKHAVETLDAAGHTLRVFLASPGDVKDERRLALKVIDKLRTDPGWQKVAIESVAWDKPDDQTPLLAGIDPQDAITQGLPRPAACDIFVALFWSRMGTPLDASRYAKPDGGQYRSGTEWELEEALQAFKDKRRPRVLVYRRTEKILLDPSSRDFKEKLEQWERVQDFFATFNNPDGSIRLAYNAYETSSQFSDLFEQHLKKLLAQLIEERHAADHPTTRPLARDHSTTRLPDHPTTRLPDYSTTRLPDSTAGAWPKGKSPFPGLRAFGPDDALVFFGRGAETDQLLGRLKDPACRFLAVVGASGSGKSSLVGAGLVPRLREGALPGSEKWPVITFTPDAWGKGDPFDALIGALLADPLRLPMGDLGRRLRANAAGLREVLEEHLAHAPEWVRAVLFIDQFEETFTRVPDEAVRQTFCAALDEAARSPRVLIVATMRDDFYHYCVKSPVLSRLINRNQDSTYTLSAPAPLELYEMLAGPAQVAGLAFEPGLVRQLLNDTGAESGALALLAYALDQLYTASAGSGQLTMKAYHAFGGVQGAIGARAQATFAALSAEAQAALPRVFRELVEVDESGAATRKRAPLAQVQSDADCAQLTQKLIQARLLVTSAGATHFASASHLGDEALVEVAHEALFRSWPRLKAWIEEAQDDLILLRQVRSAAAWWASHNRQPAYLWPDERLQPVYQMQDRLNPELTEIEKEFIRSEFDRLLEEIDNPMTTHRRRSFIGERIDTLGDRRPGVSLVGAGQRSLAGNEARLWGDKPEHAGLPDMVWLKVSGGKIKIEGETYTVQPFYIAKHPVTYTQFQAFIDAPDGFQNSRWWKDLAADDKHKRQPDEQNFKFGNHPRENVSWYDAVAFCRWLNARLNWPDIPAKLTLNTLGRYPGLRLLTEWEWQWAATLTPSPLSHKVGEGMGVREYPWGPEWDSAKANTSESGLGRTTAVGMYPAGAAPCGTLDMSGNVWEWCLNEYEKPDNISLNGSNTRVVRGGAWDSYGGGARTAFRYWGHPASRYDSSGFRLGVRPPSLNH